MTINLVIVDIFSWYSIKSALICEICGNGKRTIWKFENSKIYAGWKDYACGHVDIFSSFSI